MSESKKLPKWTEVYPQGTREGDEEQAFFLVLARHQKYDFRSVSAIEKESGLPAHRVEEIIAKYYKKGMIVQSPKNEDMWGYWERIPPAPPAKPTIARKDQNDRITKAAGDVVETAPTWINVNETNVQQAVQTAQLKTKAVDTSVGISHPNIPSIITFDVPTPCSVIKFDTSPITFSAPTIPSIIGGPLPPLKPITFGKVPEFKKPITFGDISSIKVNWGKPAEFKTTVSISSGAIGPIGPIGCPGSPGPVGPVGISGVQGVQGAMGPGGSPGVSSKPVWGEMGSWSMYSTTPNKASDEKWGDQAPAVFNKSTIDVTWSEAKTDTWPTLVNPYVPKPKAETAWKEVTQPEIVNTRHKNVAAMKADQLMSDYDILTQWCNKTPQEAETMIASLKAQKLEDARIQVLAQNG